MKKVITIIIGFIHDLAAGCWGASVLAVFWLDGRLAACPDQLLKLQKQFFFLGLACVVMVMATGAGRSFTYVENVYGEDAEKMRRKLLIIKHILLFAIFGCGTYWQYWLVYATP